MKKRSMSLFIVLVVIINMVVFLPLSSASQAVSNNVLWNLNAKSFYPPVGNDASNLSGASTIGTILTDGLKDQPTSNRWRIEQVLNFTSPNPNVVYEFAQQTQLDTIVIYAGNVINESYMDGFLVGSEIRLAIKSDSSSEFIPISLTNFKDKRNTENPKQMLTLEFNKVIAKELKIEILATNTFNIMEIEAYKINRADIEGTYGENVLSGRPVTNHNTAITNFTNSSLAILTDGIRAGTGMSALTPNRLAIMNVPVGSPTYVTFNFGTPVDLNTLVFYGGGGTLTSDTAQQISGGGINIEYKTSSLDTVYKTLPLNRFNSTPRQNDPFQVLTVEFNTIEVVELKVIFANITTLRVTEIEGYNYNRKDDYIVNELSGVKVSSSANLGTDMKMVDGSAGDINLLTNGIKKETYNDRWYKSGPSKTNPPYVCFQFASESVDINTLVFHSGNRDNINTDRLNPDEIVLSYKENLEDEYIDLAINNSYSVTYRGQELTLEFDTITAKEIKISFVTSTNVRLCEIEAYNRDRSYLNMPEPMYEMEIIENNAIIAANTSRNALAIIAEYNNPLNLKNVEIRSVWIDEDGENIIPLEEYYGKNIKVMVWDNLYDIIPLCSASKN